MAESRKSNAGPPDPDSVAPVLPQPRRTEPAAPILPEQTPITADMVQTAQSEPNLIPERPAPEPVSVISVGSPSTGENVIVLNTACSPVVEAAPVAAQVAPQYVPYQQTEQLYEVVTDTWGSQPPVFYKGNTFVPSMLPPNRDLQWAEELLVVAKIAPTDPRSLVPPTGPTGDQTGVPSDGWASKASPHQIAPEQVPSIVAAMKAAGATPAMIAAVQAQAGRSLPIGAPPVPAGTPGA